jgi:leucyl-tRNA synthetase
MGPTEHSRTGGVDLYVGGAEHAVLHLLYARFWHKVLHDLGHLSSTEPFRRLVNQGYIQAPAYTDERGFYVEASEVEERDGAFFHAGQPVTREFGKIGKSLKNMITPDDLIAEFGADTLRLYEMFTGPLDQSRPWETKAVVGVFRLLQRIWRTVLDEETGAVRVVDEPADDDTRRILHKSIAAVREGMESLRFNVSIARITELNNHLTTRYPDGGVPREVAEPLVLLLAPLAPHTAEELWARMGHESSLAWAPFPEADPALLIDDTIEVPVQVNGKVKARITVAAGLSKDELEAAARADAQVVQLLAGTTVRKVIAVPDRLVNFVVG